MCATDGQTQLGDAETAAYKQATQLTQQQYQNQQNLDAPMIAKFQSVFNAGPSQEGFSANEVNDLNAQAVQGTATNYASAAKAVGEQTAALGGGTNPLPTGGAIQLKQQIANSAAAELSKQETAIKGADYSQGFKNYEDAEGGLGSIAAGENPLGYENAATNAGNSASSQQNAIASENTGWESAALGAAGKVGSAWLGA